MDLQVKKLKVNISTTPRQTSLSPVPIITPKQRQITHNPQLRGRTMKTYFKMYCNIFKTCNKRMHFLLECPFGDFEQKPGRYNY